jgi:hypothetical protein
MSVWSVSDVTQGIAGSLRKAAQATGAGFDYLVKTAMRESSMDPTAKAKTTSAAGMFQFVEQTWLEMVKQAGPKYGLDAEAAAISRTANGRYTVSDPKARASILALRHDTEVSALMAGEFTERNRSMMTAALRRPPSEGELYAAHFLGAQGATDLIRLASANPEAKAASYFPDAASANSSIFYSGGKARSAADVLARLVRKHDSTPSVPEAAAPMLAQGPASFFTNAAPAERTTGPVLAYADDRPVFHSMFQTARRPPVSSYVHGIWADLVPAGAAAQGGNAAAMNGQPLDLSTFLKPGVKGPAGGV